MTITNKSVSLSCQPFLSFFLLLMISVSVFLSAERKHTLPFPRNSIASTTHHARKSAVVDAIPHSFISFHGSDCKKNLIFHTTIFFIIGSAVNGKDEWKGREDDSHKDFNFHDLSN